MPIDSKTAAAIAHEHGLTLADVPALRLLADDEDEARERARQFTPTATANAGEQLADQVWNRTRP